MRPRLPNPNRKLDDLRQAAIQARMPFDREAWMNVAFYLNRQYVEWHATRSDPVGFLREIEPTNENEPRTVINKIMHFVRTACADATRDRPTGDVLPPTSDYMDISDALVAKAWIEDQTGPLKLDFDNVLDRAVLWAMLAGTGWLKWVWDGQAGRPKVCAPGFFEVYVDPYAKTFADARYVIQSSFMDVEQVYDLYGKEVQPSNASEADLAKAALLRGMGAAPALSGVVVHELWMKPSRRYAKGQFAVWTGRDRLIEPGNLPYEHLIEDRMLPYTQLGVIERPDSPYFTSPVEYLRSPQMELNIVHNQMLRNGQNFSNSKVFLPAGVELSEPWDDSPDQVLKNVGTDPTAVPQVIQPQLFNADSRLQFVEEGMMHVVGQREVSNAQVPGRVEAAKAIELLKEADAGALAVVNKTMDSSIIQGFHHLLQLARQYQRTADIVPVYSKEGIPQVEHFMAGAMKAGFRIRTSRTSHLAQSRTNRVETIMRMVELGILDKERDRETIASLLEMPLSTSRPDAEHRMLARNENLTLAKGEAVEPNSWDEHEVHLREHDSFRTTMKYLALSPEAKKRFEHHCQRHKALLKEQIAERAMLQAIAQGGQPPTPAPAPAVDEQNQEASTA